jgi:hypothetical protein
MSAKDEVEARLEAFEFAMAAAADHIGNHKDSPEAEDSADISHAELSDAVQWYVETHADDLHQSQLIRIARIICEETAPS